MNTVQAPILQEIPNQARYLFFSLKPKATAKNSLIKLSQQLYQSSMVVGLGDGLIKHLGKAITGMKTFPAIDTAGISVPSTPMALWIWLVGDDRGELLHQTYALEQELAEDFQLQQVIDSFKYQECRDLTGYEDGTENPEGQEAIDAAIVQGQGEGMDGSSFVAVQQWLHDLKRFQNMPVSEQDNTIGRRISDNEEIEEAPESAHVKRTAQEDFDPEAFVVRRSMPWSEENRAGLVFVAFGHSYDAYESLLNKMVGKEDGIVDALFNFTHPITGAYYWCPPIKDEKLDLSGLGF